MNAGVIKIALALVRRLMPHFGVEIYLDQENSRSKIPSPDFRLFEATELPPGWLMWMSSKRQLNNAFWTNWSDYYQRGLQFCGVETRPHKYTPSRV